MPDENAETLAEEGLDAPTQMPPPAGEPSPEPAVPQSPKPLLVTEAAFVCFLDENGHWMADSGSVNRPIQVAREANFIDMFHSCHTVIKDIEVQETARQVVGLQQQMAMQMAEQMRTAEVAKQMGGPVGAGLDLSKLRSPGQ